jgi:hypothetical protein
VGLSPWSNKYPHTRQGKRHIGHGSFGLKSDNDICDLEQFFLACHVRDPFDIHLLAVGPRLRPIASCDVFPSAFDVVYDWAVVTRGLIPAMTVSRIRDGGGVTGG